jgi:two-component sensor histidine kinase
MKLLLVITLFLAVSFSNLAQNNQKILESYLKIQTDSIRFDSLINLGNRSEFDDKNISLRSYQELLKIAQKLNDKTRTARALYLLGCEEQVFERNDLAIKYLQQSYQLYDELKLYKKVIKCSNKIAQVLDAQQDHKSAYEYFKKTLALSLKYDYPEYAAYSYVSIGNYQNGELKDYKSALESYKKGIALCEKLKLNDAYYDGLLNLVGLYKNMKDYDNALKTIEEPIKFYHDNNTYGGFGEALALEKKGEVLYEKKDYVQAQQITMKSLQLVENQAQSLELRVEVTDLLRKIYDAQNNIPAAYQTQKKWRVLYDTLTNQNARKTVATLQTQFETVQKETQIRELDEQNQSQQTQLIWAILGITILVISLIGGYYLYQKLNQNKLKVDEQSQQLTTLMKELHHRVKNNLAIVSSLLSMQSNRLEDKNAAKAVKEGQMRVQAMSLIHQRLYKTDDVSTVNIKDYFTELAESLMQAYGYSSDDFELTIEVKNPALDVDLAIPLGLIVNELITNSFKYAYEGIERPSLDISLKNDKDITLKIQDNGIGIDEKLVSQKSNSFGQKLIKGLSKQLKGTYKFENNHGTYFELNIPKVAA